jgi:Dockerin type I domain/Right handed beta helix region
MATSRRRRGNGSSKPNCNVISTPGAYLFRLPQKENRRMKYPRTRAMHVERLPQRILLSADVASGTALFGDANLDGVIDGSDYSLVDNGFNTGAHGWQNGDFNGDGHVDGTDYSILDAAADGLQPPGTVYRVGPDEPLQTISAAAALAQPGDVVLIDPGTYSEQVILPISGTPSAPIVFEAAIPGTVIVDGTGFTSIFNGGNGYGGQSWINVEGITFQNCSNPLQTGAVVVGSDSILSDCTVQYCDSSGIVIQGDGATLNNDIAQFNGEQGFKGNGCSNATLNDCITRYNNTGMVAPNWAGQPNTLNVNGLWYVNPNWEAGGGKFDRTNNIVIYDMQSYGNVGQGLSFDINDGATTITDSSFTSELSLQHDYESIGLTYEISNGPAVISNCVFSNDIGSGLYIGTSSNVLITGNVFENGSELNITNWDRGSDWVLNNVVVTGNTFDDSLVATNGNEYPWDATSLSAMQLTIANNGYLDAPPIEYWWGVTGYSLQDAVDQLGVG